MTARRHVLFLAGFDSIDVPSQHRRFQREAAKFAQTWQVSAAVSDVEAMENGARWRLRVAAPNWQNETAYELFDWCDLVRVELDRSRLALLLAGFWTFADFVLTGTAARYFAATWRYGLFFLVPFVNVVLFAVAAAACATIIARWLSLGPALDLGVGLVLAVAVFALLMRWPGRRWRVVHAFADWIFARDYMLGRRADLETRLDAFSERLCAVVRASDADEILVVGHSLGATMAVDVIARALARDPELAAGGPAICLLTVGATIPKLALHPKAKRLREAIARVARHSQVIWAEFQARSDPISFYKFDPVTLQPFTHNAAGRNPRIGLVGIKDMLAPESNERIKYNHMRKHYQFVMGNEQRAIYDYFMLIGGPVPFARLTDLPKGALDAFDDDGAYRLAGGTSTPAAAGQA
jgi:hypothetical protein